MKDNRPSLVIMAAGMGSRYGGLKQIDPVDKEGHKIIDFSVFDAKRAGFKKAVFVIKRENKEDFEEAILKGIAANFPVEFAFQELSDIPEGFDISATREKPWGTAHAVLSARDALDGPFAVINADDFYGFEAFRKISDFLSEAGDEAGKYRYAMAGFVLKNTLTENGSVSRGICEVSPEGSLISVTERTKIERYMDRARYSEDGGATYGDLSGNETVSMNFWGFSPSILSELDSAFRLFLEGLPKAPNPDKAECYLPSVVDSLIKSDKATVAVLPSFDKWFGVTYKEDKPYVMECIEKLKAEGAYPERLWG